MSVTSIEPPPAASAAVSPAPETPAPVPVVASQRWAHALAVGTGLLYFLAFPGIDVWPLGFVAWVPLLLAMRGRSVRQQTRLAWLSGFTMTFVGFYWMLGMLQNFSGFPVVACLAFMLLLAAYQGGRIGLFGFFYARSSALGWWRCEGAACDSRRGSPGCRASR